MRRWRAPGLLFLLAVCLLRAQVQWGPQERSFFSEVDDSDQPYTLYLPKNYTPSRRYPLVISLHGAYSNNRLNLRRVFGKGNQPNESDIEATRFMPPLPEVNYIVASPLARGSLGYQGIPEKDVYDVLADVKAHYAVDEDRTFLTGLSMGGGGALWLGLTRPDIWAGVFAVSPYAPREAFNLAPNALNLNIHLAHGAADPVVPVDESRRWAALFGELGTKAFDYAEYPNVLHNAWDRAYANGALFKWLERFRRDPHPARVRFASLHYKYNQAYWVQLDQFTPGVLATVDARFTGINQLVVNVTNLEGFTCRLRGHPSVVPGQMLHVEVNGQPIDVPQARDSIAFRKEDGHWTPGFAGPVGHSKRPGLEGPLSAAISGRHIYVYGTADNPPPAELDRRRNEALQAANWASPGVKLELWPRVVGDRYVRQSDWDTSDLIVFGNYRTNRILQQMRAELPLELLPAAKDYGLLYIWPRGPHYVVVVSGESVDEMLAHHEGRRYMPFMQAGFNSLPDFLITHQSEHVVEGRFTNQWTIPEELAQQIRRLGVVGITTNGPS